MAKLLHISTKSWFDELNSIAYYVERDYEKFINQYISEIFPDFITFGFKYAIASPDRKDRKPDMAFVKKDYSEWWLVEIELGSDDIKHVREQIEVFLNPEYNSVVLAEKIVKMVKRQLHIPLDNDKIKFLIEHELPKVLVIIDDEKTSWLDEIKSLGAEVCIFEIYKNTNAERVFRIDGNYPTSYIGESHCRYHPSLRNLLEVINPSFLDLSKVNLEIFYKGKVTTWILLKERGRVYLQFAGTSNPVLNDVEYVLHIDSENNLHIKRN